MNQNNPLELIQIWLENEKLLGSTLPARVVLATATTDGIPHSRTVAIREISDKGIIFFTQKGTRKVIEISQNPHASMTLWLPMQQKQVILDGIISPLTSQNNLHYWKTIPREQQIRFFTYAPLSGQSIPSLTILEEQARQLTDRFKNQDIPMSGYYCGFHLIASSIFFYTLGSHTFSEVYEYQYHDEQWAKQMLSP
jgi:pyridoxamine 5'-phosphate oxidase